MKVIQDAMLFVDVAQAGSLTAAAERLYASKSSISRRISQLEQRLNVQLFIRDTQGLQLTEAGRQFYDACYQIKASFEQATERLYGQHSTVTGSLTLSAPLSFGSMFIGPLLAKLMRNYPQLKVNLDLSDHVKSLSSGEVDIAIRAASRLSDSGLKARKLFAYKHIVCASPDYLNASAQLRSLEDLSRHRTICCLTGSASISPDIWTFLVNDEQLDVAINPVARVTHMDVQKNMALEDQGLIRLPEYWVKEEIATGQLMPVLTQYPTPDCYMFAVYQNIQPMPAKIITCLDYLTEHLTVSGG